MRLTALPAIAKLLLWGSLVLFVLAANASASAHTTGPHYQGISVHEFSRFAIDQNADRGDHGSTNDHNCAHHSGGGCGAQWAFLSAEIILPVARSIAWVSLGRTVLQRGALIPLDHPPKSSLFH